MAVAEVPLGVYKTTYNLLIAADYFFSLIHEYSELCW